MYFLESAEPRGVSKQGGSGRHQISRHISRSRVYLSDPTRQAKKKELDIGSARAVGSQTEDIGRWVPKKYLAVYIAYFYFEEGLSFRKSNLEMYSGKAIPAKTQVVADDGTPVGRPIPIPRFSRVATIHKQCPTIRCQRIVDVQ